MGGLPNHPPFEPLGFSWTIQTMQHPAGYGHGNLGWFGRNFIGIQRGLSQIASSRGSQTGVHRCPPFVCFFFFFSGSKASLRSPCRILRQSWFLKDVGCLIPAMHVELQSRSWKIQIASSFGQFTSLHLFNGSSDSFSIFFSFFDCRNIPCFWLTWAGSLLEAALENREVSLGNPVARSASGFDFFQELCQPGRSAIGMRASLRRLNVSHEESRWFVVSMVMFQSEWDQQSATDFRCSQELCLLKLVHCRCQV